MPKCGEKVEHTGNSKGEGYDPSEDKAWDASKDSARYWALIDAATWANSNVGECPEGCTFRRVYLQLDDIRNPDCHRVKKAKGKHQWECKTQCTWHVTVVCRKRRIPTPKDDGGNPFAGGINKRRRLKCHEETWDEGTGSGSATDKDRQNAEGEAKLNALKDAYEQAAKKLKMIRCASRCPVEMVGISTEPPADPRCQKGDNGKWECSSTCEYKISISCDSVD